MQIKVETTRMQTVHTKGKKPFDQWGDVPVAEAKLVLIDKWPNIEGQARIDRNRWITVNGKEYKPILISETEKIEEGDWVYDTIQGGEIEQVSKEWIQKWIYAGGFQGWRKIIALPEHFSPKHLQAIVEGKMKDGDKVLVEVRRTMSIIQGNGHIIKLNPSNYITLHKIEEKMYNETIFIDALWKYSQFCIDMEVGRDYVTAKNWFEQNVR